MNEIKEGDEVTFGNPSKSTWKLKKMLYHRGPREVIQGVFDERFVFVCSRVDGLTQEEVIKIKTLYV